MTPEECVRQFQGHFILAVCKLLPLAQRGIKHPTLVKNKKNCKEEGRIERTAHYPTLKGSLTDHKKWREQIALPHRIHSRILYQQKYNLCLWYWVTHCRKYQGNLQHSICKTITNRANASITNWNHCVLIKKLTNVSPERTSKSEIKLCPSLRSSYRSFTCFRTCTDKCKNWT